MFVLIGAMFIVQPAYAETGGYPYASLNGPGTNPSGSFWADSTGNGINSATGYNYRNCTDYVAWKLQSLNVADSKTRGLGNGGQWATNAQNRSGVTVENTPSVYSAAVTPSTSSDPYGHVAFVESVQSNGTITVSEYNRRSSSTGLPDGAYHTRTGTPSSLGFSKFVNFGIAPSNNVSDGSYIKTASSGSVYVVAGNSAVPVPSWQSVGGEKPVTTITQQQLDSMTYYPADGTYVTDYGSPSVYVIVGGAPFAVTGREAVGGQKPTTMLPSSTIGTRFRQYPVDGTFVTDYGSPSVYEIVGGAPFPVPSWQSVGGQKPTGMLPASTVGTKFRQYPVDGTFVTDYGSPDVYEVAGGAGLKVTGWDAVGGSKPTTMLPASSVGTQLRSYPQDGVYLRGFSTGKIYKVQGGTTTYMSSWGSSGPQPYIDVDQWAITNQLNGVG